ncbi:MAG TPA: DUF937 domain-containing protein [Phenylobacterium sp.]|nr:DUF937 domain-containing protein [Phenylobacterium sp.]
MNINDILQQTGALDSISRELGVDPGQAQAGAAALLPAILGGFKKQAQPQAAGVDGLDSLLGGLGGSDLLGQVLGAGATPVQPGNEILGQIFGSKEVSREVASHASQTSGLDPALLKKMLPLLAMAVAGYMMSRKGGAEAPAGQGGLGGILGQVLGGALGGGRQASPAGGGLASMLDLDGDGNPLDDILGMAGKLRG